MFEKDSISVVLTIVELGSIQKAADHLGYTNAGVRYIIQRLEEELGIKLFYRKYGGVILTNEGKEILSWFKQLKKSEQSLCAKAKEIRHMNTGTIRVAAFNSASVLWLPGMIEQFRSVYPNVKIEIVMYDEVLEGRELLRQGEVDCGIYMAPVEDDLKAYPLVSVPIVAIVSPSDPLSKRETFPVKELGKHPYVAGCGEKMSEDIFIKNSAEADIQFQVDNDYCAMALVSKGFGFCLIPQSLAEISPFPVVSLQLDNQENMDVVIAVRGGEPCTNSVQTFVNRAMAWIADRKEKGDV